MWVASEYYNALKPVYVETIPQTMCNLKLMLTPSLYNVFDFLLHSIDGNWRRVYITIVLDFPR